jgi:hypothetical protein
MSQFSTWEASGKKMSHFFTHHCGSRGLAVVAASEVDGGHSLKSFKDARNSTCTTPFSSHVEARDNSRRPNPAAQPQQQRAQPEWPRQPGGQRLREWPAPAPFPFALLNSLCHGISGVISVESSILQDPGSSCDALPFYDLQWGSPLASYGRRKVRSEEQPNGQGGVFCI